MDYIEAKEILDKYIDDYRRKSLTELYQILNNGRHTFEFISISGTEYQIEIDVMWDNRRQNTLRLFGSIDDGKISVFGSGAVTTSVIIQKD